MTDLMLEAILGHMEINGMRAVDLTEESECVDECIQVSGLMLKALVRNYTDE
jgi:hypothetical protein